MHHIWAQKGHRFLNFFDTYQVPKDTLWKIGLIQIKIYPQTSIELKYGSFYLNNKVTVHGLVLLVQLS